MFFVTTRKSRVLGRTELASASILERKTKGTERKGITGRRIIEKEKDRRDKKEEKRKSPFRTEFAYSEIPAFFLLLDLYLFLISFIYCTVHYSLQTKSPLSSKHKPTDVKSFSE